MHLLFCVQKRVHACRAAICASTLPTQWHTGKNTGLRGKLRGGRGAGAGFLSLAFERGTYSLRTSPHPSSTLPQPPTSPTTPPLPVQCNLFIQESLRTPSNNGTSLKDWPKAFGGGVGVGRVPSPVPLHKLPQECNPLT